MAGYKCSYNIPHSCNWHSFKTLSFNYKYPARSDCQLDPKTEKYTSHSANTYSKRELSLEFTSKE